MQNNFPVFEYNKAKNNNKNLKVKIKINLFLKGQKVTKTLSTSKTILLSF